MSYFNSFYYKFYIDDFILEIGINCEFKNLKNVEVFIWYSIFFKFLNL